MNVAKGFAIRAGEGAIQVRITDHSWSLPTGVEGAIAIRNVSTTLIQPGSEFKLG